MSQVTDIREFADLSPNVREFIGRTQKLYIDGQWVAAASGKTFDTIDPSTEQVICKVAEAAARMWIERPKQRTRPSTVNGRA